MIPFSRPRRPLALAIGLALLAGAPLLAASARTIVLVRHGAYDADDKADSRWGSGLTPIGVAQARLAGARLAGLPFRFDSVLASPLTRAKETAQVIAADLPGAKIEIAPELEECTPPTWRTASVADEKPAQMAACAAKLDKVFADRFVPSPDAERHDLVVAHGNVIRYLVTRALSVDTKAWLEMSIGHASMTVIRVEADGTFKVIAVGDVGHLPPNLQTGATGNPARDLTVPVP